MAVAALLSAISLPALVIAQSGERSITIHNIHTKETVTAVYKRNGRYDPSGLEKINRVMRDHRRDEATSMDPDLIDLLWQIHAELGSREPIHLISGYRSKASNELLRKTVGGQASESRHILGKAADVHFPDVPIKKLRYSALLHEKGGVGYYPTSALPFVHVDTDRVRAWPRLPRHELALLFPSGQTRHAPADGGPITKEDVRAAQARHGDLAQQVALFHADRLAPKAPETMAVADARPARRPEAERVALLSAPPSIAQPVLVERPAPAARSQSAASLPRLVVPPAPSAGDRARLDQLAGLASMTPQLVFGPTPARRPAKVAGLASLTGNTPPPLPAQLFEDATALAPERQVASLAGIALPASDPAVIQGDVGGGGWVPAPAYDEEHPEELSYRPFPILPFLTATAAEPLMSEFAAHDPARTLDVLDQLDGVPPLHFRPGVLSASLLWAQQFTGSAAGLDKVRAPQDANTAGAGLATRPVRTSQR